MKFSGYASSMKDRRVCFIGESFVQGAGDPLGLGWVGRVVQAANTEQYWLTAYNLGIRGETSTELNTRWAEETARRLSGHHGGAVFSFGTNDAVTQAGHPRVPLTETLEAAWTILKGAAAQYSTLMISPPAVPDVAMAPHLSALVDELAVLCSELNMPYLDVYTPLSKSQIWLREAAQGDGAHPASEGYKLYSELVLSWPEWHTWLENL